MRFSIALASALALVGCDHRKPAVSEKDFQIFRASHPGMTQRCLDDYRYGGFDAWAREPDEPACYEMLPDRRWTGLWETGWEWTNFCPDPAKDCDWMSKRGIWLRFAKGAPKVPDGLYRIEFVGRRTKVAGYHGHLNHYEHLMVVDHLISLGKILGEKYSKR